MTFAKLLTKFRGSMSKTELAKKIGIVPSYIMMLEAGQKKPPTMQRCRQIADALEINKEDALLLFQAAAGERIGQEELEFYRKMRRDTISDTNKDDAFKFCPNCGFKLDGYVVKKGGV